MSSPYIPLCKQSTLQHMLKQSAAARGWPTCPTNHPNLLMRPRPEADVLQYGVQILPVPHNQVLCFNDTLTWPALRRPVVCNHRRLLWRQLCVLDHTLHSIHVDFQLSALPHHPVHQTCALQACLACDHTCRGNCANLHVGLYGTTRKSKTNEETRKMITQQVASNITEGFLPGASLRCAQLMHKCKAW